MHYLGRKALFYLIAAWASITLNFLLPRLAPGNPVDAVLARQAQNGPLPPDARRSVELLLGVKDEPLWRQYIDYLVNLARGDFGLSTTYFPTPVATVVGQALPWTLVLVGVTTMVTFVLGTGIGTVLGWRRGRWADMVVPATTFFAAMPYFWLALMLLYVFGLQLGWVPLFGGMELGTVVGWNTEFILGAMRHALLPAITIIIGSFAGWALGMRNMMVATLGEDYVTAARAKGLAPRRIMIAYAARNAILPNVAGLAISLGFVVGGSIVSEVVFSYPGVGGVLMQAVGSSDYLLMQALFLIITLSVLITNFAVDLLYVFIDPRTRQTA